MRQKYSSEIVCYALILQRTGKAVVETAFPHFIDKIKNRCFNIWTVTQKGEKYVC